MRLIILCICLTLSSAKLVVAAPTNWTKESFYFSYTPSEFHFVNGKAAVLSRESIAKDLQVLRPYSTGLILYATDENTQTILAVALELRFKSVVLGIWSVNDKAEVQAAVALAKQYPNLINAMAIGNEGLFFKRYTKENLNQTMTDVRRQLPHVAITTTEPFASYFGQPASLDCDDQDFLLPTIHPVFEPWFRPTATTQSVNFVMNVIDRLTTQCHKPVIVKETGVPSGPKDLGYSEQQQRAFWKDFLDRLKPTAAVSVSLFEAFDAPWKAAELKKQTGHYDEREGHWGWFYGTREPKGVVTLLKPLRQ